MMLLVLKLKFRTVKRTGVCDANRSELCMRILNMLGTDTENALDLVH